MNIPIAKLVKTSGAKLKGLSPRDMTASCRLRDVILFFIPKNEEQGFDNEHEQLDAFRKKGV